MWKLTIEDDEGQRTSLDLALDEYTIGRAEDRAIRLTERNISRKHAILRLTVDGWELEDEGAYNGSYVNGQRVGEEPAIMQSGDVIQLGDYRIEMLDAAEVQPRPEEPRQRRPDRLVMVIGPMPGIEFSLDGDRLSIGRAEEAHISINHASVSRLHAELINLGQSRWEVIDQGSSNGLRINGVELRRGIIEPGDALELGDVRLRFVAAGKFFRPMVDISAQLPAVGGFEGMTPAAAARAQGTRNFGTIFAVALLAVALVVAGLVIVGGRTTTSNAGSNGDVVRPIATTEEDQKDALARAQELAQQDIFQAHTELLRIPEDSELRDTDEYRALEDRWAEAMFDKAENTDDPAEKRRLYNEVSETTTVSAEKRKKAAEYALNIPAEEASAPRPFGIPPGPRIQPTTPYDSAKPEPAASAPSPVPDDKFDPKAHKNGLMAKMNSGRATIADLQMLKAICMGEGDRACRDAAVAEIKRKQSQGQ